MHDCATRGVYCERRRLKRGGFEEELPVTRPRAVEGEEPPKKPQSFLNSGGSFLSGGSA